MTTQNKLMLFLGTMLGIFLGIAVVHILRRIALELWFAGSGFAFPFTILIFIALIVFSIKAIGRR